MNTRENNSLMKKLFAHRETMLAVIVIVCFVVLSITNPAFLRWSNLKVVISGLSVDGIIVVGMTIVMISGGLDLSVGSTMCLAMTVAATLFRSGWNPWIASLAGILIGAVIGLMIGVIVTKVKLTHFIVSLCFMGIGRGLVYAITTGSPISLVSDLKEYPSFSFLGQGSIGSFPMAPVCFIIIAVLAGLFVAKSAGMRRVFYTGSNENAAAFSGIHVNRVKILSCIACGVLAALSGIIYMIRYSGVAVSAGSGAEMTALSAAVIGGCSMNGGKGSIAGSVLGLLFILIIKDAMTLFLVPSYWQDLIQYLIVLLAVMLDGAQQIFAARADS